MALSPEGRRAFEEYFPLDGKHTQEEIARALETFLTCMAGTGVLASLHNARPLPPGSIRA